MNLKPWLLMLPLVYSLSGGEICTHDSKPWRLGAMEKREQSLQCIEYSPEIGKVLEISMVPSVFSYIELNYRNRLSIAADENELKKPNLHVSLPVVGDAGKLIRKRSNSSPAHGAGFRFRLRIPPASGAETRIARWITPSVSRL